MLWPRQRPPSTGSNVKTLFRTVKASKPDTRSPSKSASWPSLHRAAPGGRGSVGGVLTASAWQPTPQQRGTGPHASHPTTSTTTNRSCTGCTLLTATGCPLFGHCRNDLFNAVTTCPRQLWGPVTKDSLLAPVPGIRMSVLLASQQRILIG